MNARQREALEDHCRLDEEVLNPRRRSRHGSHSVILTVNSGYE